MTRRNLKKQKTKKKEIEVTISKLGSNKDKVKDSALRYTVGYSIFKVVQIFTIFPQKIFLSNQFSLQTIITKIKCEKCTEVIICKDSALEKPSEAFIKHKNFDKQKLVLINPDNEFFRISKIHLQVFEYFYHNFLHIKNLKKMIVKQAISKTMISFPNWFKKTDPCLKHKKQILNFFITLLLKKTCNWRAETVIASNIFLN